MASTKINEKSISSATNETVNNTSIKNKNSSEGNPFLTFAVPLRNKISYLERFALSILQYTNTNRNSENDFFEMVVVDANSDDGSFEFFEYLSSILKGSTVSNKKTPKLEKYHIDQFIVNSSLEKKSSFSSIPISGGDILEYDRSCLDIKVIKKKEIVLSNMARQIAVKNARGEYIWQVDPDDMINTLSLSSVLQKLRSSNFPDIFEFGFVEYVMNDNGKIGRTIKSYRSTVRINSSFEIYKRFLTRATNWQLWQCFVKRSVYLNAIDTINEMVKNQDKVVAATDLFHYAPIVFHSKSYASVKDFGYSYFYMNNDSVSYSIWKGKVKTQESGRIVYDFIVDLFNNTGIVIKKSLQKIYM